ncbi:MAG TPA: hypothetical protein DIT04_01190 [Dysgonomonas sp.]|nr:hypothetical protein [Dysgonomonas sp.]
MMGKMGRKLFFLFVCGFIFSSYTYSQVGINTENPYKLSELQIKNIVENGDTIPKGIIIPRLTEKQRKDIDVAEVDSVNSLLIYNIDEDCYNYYSKLENEWQSLCGKLGKAQFSMDCSSTKVSGQYLNDKNLTTANYITVTVNVTKVGSYSITALPDPENGYYFIDSGEFLATGEYSLILKGMGTPNDFTPNGDPGDLIKFYLQGIEAPCTERIIIEDSSIKPNYSMNCNTVKVNGVYALNKPLTNTNTITMTLDVQSDAAGAHYIITTDEVDGISFSGTGIIGAGLTQVVTLYGTGTPTSLEPKIMTITSNSAINVATCKATVHIAYTKKTILGMGHYDNAFGYHINSSATLAVMNRTTNFGTLENSTVKCEGFEYNYIHGATDLPLASSIPNASRLNAELAKNPDIIVIAYTFNFDDNTSSKLLDYLNKGGVVILFNEYYPTLANSAVRFFQDVFADPSISGTNRNARGKSYRLSSTNDEILNGPFGDARGKLWGEDASATLTINGLPLGDIDVYSNATCVAGPTYSGVTMFKHKSLNLFFVGDGGFNSNNNTYIGPSYGDAGICPFAIDSNYKPIPRTNWGEGANATNQTVYNSIIFANVMAWAIKQAQFNGINTK